MSAARVRVMIADDEGPILAATRDLLQEYDYEVETHAEAATIHERLRATRAAILLQDVRMPGLDVRALVRDIRADASTRGTRIILFSASLEAVELGRELDVPVVPKPFTPQKILAALRSA